MALTSRSLLKHGSALSLLTLFSRVLGLLREMTKASLLGTSALSDAFSVAFMTPNLFRRLFAEGSISVAFIPTFKEYLLQKSKREVQEFLCCILTFLSFFVSLAVALGILAAPLIIRLFGLEEFNEAVLLTRFMFPFLAFISIAALFQGILNSVNCFTPSGFAPILLNITAIVCAYALKDAAGNPARAMAVGILLGGFLEAAMQVPFVVKHGFTFFFTGLKKAVNHPGTKTVLKLVGPTIIGMAAYQLNDLASTALAGNAGEGVVSSLQYSLRLQELILGVFAVSIGTVLLPDLSEHAKSGNWDCYNDRLKSAMRIIAFITIPITFFALAQGESLIRLLFQGRSFTETSVALTKTAFAFHIPAILFVALNRILAPAFYAQGDSKSPTFAGVISFAVNMAVAAALVSPMRGAGVALALTIASAINTMLLLVFLKKNPLVNINQTVWATFLYALKMCCFSAALVTPLLFLTPLLLELFARYNRFIHYGVPLVIAAALYFSAGLALLVITKDKQVYALLRMIRRKTAHSDAPIS
ncbi:MAG: murein biosynthesis integral membrane protein MurJ [Treponema sp.]|nr:murein biosynthesis integral membrane protein MurJ [Treponema sp.]